MKTLEEFKKLKESEDKVEFKEAKEGTFPYSGGDKVKPSDRRRCILGYVTALCNEGGGYLVFGMTDQYPHKIVGTKLRSGSIGQLEADIYNDTKIRVNIAELYENGNRVLAIEIPGRPVGKVFKFEDVALMRVGEELKPMSDEVYLKYIQEQEPDFSAQICESISIDDLDPVALSILKEKYAAKQNNPRFLTLPDEQILSDLDLIRNNKPTYSALILLGKEKKLREVLPQCATMLEYRNSESQIHFDNRIPFTQPFFILIEDLWKTINLRNGSFPIQEGAYIFNIPYFNEEVIREAINNAIAHRDYRRTSEIVIKQYPQRLDILNPGGFPIGVTLDNLLTTASTPRNRLLTDILQKTGIVERSGQGIDKIFYKTLSEGKAYPDYSQTDTFQVTLILSSVIKDKAFVLFIESIQENLKNDQKLSIMEILTLAQIRDQIPKENLLQVEVEKLLKRKLIEKRGKTNAIKYIMSKDYYDFTDQKVEYFKLTDWDDEQSFQLLSSYLMKNETIKMKDIVCLFEGILTKKQVRTTISNLKNEGRLESQGEKASAVYFLGKQYKEQMEILSKAVEIGLKRMKRDGDI